VKKSSRNRPVDAPVWVIPDRVGVAMADIAENMREGPLALAAGAGLLVLAALKEADVDGLAGPKGSRHNVGRTAVRHGREPGPPTGPGSCRSRRMSCSPRRRFSAS
jgi:putative transposase